MVFSKVIVGVTNSRRSFVFDQSRAKVSTSFTNVSDLAVAAFDPIYCSLCVLGRTYLHMIRTTVWMTTTNFEAIMVSSDRWGSIGLIAIKFHRSRPLLFWITLPSLEQWTSAATETAKTSTCTPRNVSPSPGRRFLQALASQVACATTTEENEVPLVVYGNLASCILGFFEALTLWRPSSGCVMVFFKQNENLIFGFS